MTAKERDATILSFLPVMPRLVGVVAWRLPDHIDRDDLLGQAELDLVGAIDTWDATRGMDLERHVVNHVLNRLRDYLRSRAWAMPGSRSQTGRICVRTVPLNDETLEVPDEADPYGEVEAAETYRCVFLSARPRPRWARALRWYHWVGLPQAEIGRRMGVTESRISQILREAMEELRTAT